MNHRAGTIGILALLAAGVVAAILYVFVFKSTGAANAADVTEALAITENDIGMGDRQAPIVWIEYASAGCVHCAATALQILPTLKKTYIDTGKVYFVLRDYPLEDVSFAASMIARCLPRNQFYGFMDALFARQRQWHGPNVPDRMTALKTLAAEAGLSGVQVDNCLKDQAIGRRIVASRQTAIDVLKVQSTPTHFINGQRMAASPLSSFEAKFKDLLGQ